MNFERCARCGLSLPRSFLIPVIIQKGNQRTKVLICRNCETIIIKEQKEQKL